MDIEDVVREVIWQKDQGRTAHPADLGTAIADALAAAGLAQLGDEQVADYIREIGDRTGLTDGQISDQLTEAIEEDLEDEDEI